MSPYQLLEFLAHVTWQTIDVAGRNGIRFGEDAITSINLTSLSVSPTPIFVDDTRIDESRKGCDFEFWIGTGHFGWHRYAIQAKKISLASGAYSKLNHRVGGRRQIDILESYARANRAAPLYCFYNSREVAGAWPCCQPRADEQLGCSITPSQVVQAAIGTRGGRNFSWLHTRPETLPWRCLLCRHRPYGLFPTGTRTRWPAADSYFHQTLPESLRRRVTKMPTAIEVAEGDINEDSDLYSSETPLRPAWVVLFDVDERERPRSMPPD
jgi:hypothetical protein